MTKLQPPPKAQRSSPMLEAKAQTLGEGDTASSQRQRICRARVLPKLQPPPTAQRSSPMLTDKAQTLGKGQGLGQGQAQEFKEGQSQAQRRAHVVKSSTKLKATIWLTTVWLSTVIGTRAKGTDCICLISIYLVCPNKKLISPPRLHKLLRHAENW